MAIKKVRIRPEGGNNYADILHPETSADIVIGYKKASGVRFIVGTSTAGWTLEDCDYLCDGTNDQEEIIQALNDLPATGGEIVILDGTYNITAKINVTKDNVSIRGNGNATILKRMFNSLAASKNGVITLINRSGCKIANLQIDGNKSSYTSNYNYGIYAKGSSSYPSSNNTFIGNICNNSSEHGIYLEFSNDNVVIGNNCNNNRYGIYLYESSNNTITDNNCNNNSSTGIYARSSGSYPSNNNTFIGNTCNNNGSYGIFLTEVSDNIVIGNNCNNSRYGIQLSSSSSYPSNNNTFIGNTCNNGSYGIYLGGLGNTVANNACNNNSDRGIFIYQSSNTVVTGNTCNNNNYGIRLYESSNNTVTGNTCIRGTGTPEDYTSSQYTIHLYENKNNYNLISNNNCMGKAPVVGGGTGNTLVNNKFDAT